MSRHAALAALTALAAVGIVGCGSDSADESNAELTVVATTTQVADLVQNVGGERVAVHGFLAPNSDPHEYEPRPSDAEAVFEADVVFRSGGDLDDWLGEVVDNAGGDAEEVTLIDAIPLGRLREAGGEGAEAVDPHWWQDPGNAILVVRAIADALAAADPDGAVAYRRNVARYSARLERLDREIARCIGLVPPDRRKLVTTHDSYGYFADRYGIEVVGALIPSRSTQAQPSAGETVELTDQIEAEGVKAIFPESALDPKLERAVAEETGATVGEALWADSLGPEGSDGDTYLGALASDTAAMVEGMTRGERSCRPRV
jgi:zinc/manganese transport system substrate-binding protein